ncbi:hypothetical protein NE541_15870, partial [Coprococcus eutactus]|nr:hypothetical protein [Coprococcus eutactus]
VYAECVSKGQDKSRLQFTFDLQYPDGHIRKAVYEFALSAVETEQPGGFGHYGADDDVSSQHSKYRVKISDEK